MIRKATPNDGNNDDRNRYLPLPLGGVVMTTNAMITLNDMGGHELVAANLLIRHAAGDWGVVGDEDWAANDTALINGGRITSIYHMPNGQIVWVITEHDRSATTILLPEDY